MASDPEHFFQVSVGDLDLLSYEMPVQVLCPFLNWIFYFVVVKILDIQLHCLRTFSHSGLMPVL